MDGGSSGHKDTTYTRQHKTNNHRQRSVTRVGLKPTSTVFERHKTIRTLDYKARVISSFV